MADAANPVTVQRVGNRVRVQIYGNWYRAAETRGNVKLWPERPVSAAGTVEPEPERYFEFVFPSDAAAQTFVTDSQTRIDAAKAVIGPVT